MAACILHQAFSLAQQDGIAGQTEDEIGIAIGLNQLHQFRIREVTIAAQQDMGAGPVLPQQAQHPLHDHGILGAGRAFAEA